MTKSAKEVIEQNRQERKALAVMLASHEGQRLIAELEVMFDGDNLAVFGPDAANQTYFNLGERHVVRVLKALALEAQKE
jgi:hypothetical protein